MKNFIKIRSCRALCGFNDWKPCFSRGRRETADNLAKFYFTDSQQ